MLDQTASTLSNARLQQSRECLQSAERELAADSFKGAANRSYYCIFHAIRALLALEKTDFKKHTAIISDFRKKYIHTKIFPTEFSDIVGNAFRVRNDCDYQDFYIISKSDIEAQIANAKTLLSAVENYIAAKSEQ